jgi:hypothetical protein
MFLYEIDWKQIFWLFDRLLLALHLTLTYNLTYRKIL